MTELQDTLQAEQNARTLTERRAAGKRLRNKVPRSSHAGWSLAANRPDPLSLLEEQNRTRLQHLVPLRFARMAVSPFTFLRGSAIVMAQGLATTPVTGITVQICGDAHLNNFGIYATPERNQVSMSMILTKRCRFVGMGYQTLRRQCRCRRTHQRLPRRY